MTLQKNVKSRVFWILKKRKNVFSNYGECDALVDVTLNDLYAKVIYSGTNQFLIYEAPLSDNTYVTDDDDDRPWCKKSTTHTHNTPWTDTTL